MDVLNFARMQFAANINLDMLATGLDADLVRFNHLAALLEMMPAAPVLLETASNRVLAIAWSVAAMFVGQPVRPPRGPQGAHLGDHCSCARTKIVALAIAPLLIALALAAAAVRH